MMNQERRFFVGILDIIFPKRCVGCGKIGKYICASCKKLIIPIAPNECICPMCEKRAIAGLTHPKCQTRYSLDGLTSFFYYKDVVRQAIQTLKYRFVRDLAAEFVELVPFSAYEVRSVIGSPHALVTPIPLHATRLRYRGFNQSESLGRVVAESLRITLVPDILNRAVATLPQVHMQSKLLRRTNMRGVFRMNKTPRDIRHMIFLLFDDVFTTGATMREAGRVLKQRGARQVWAVTMAR